MYGNQTGTDVDTQDVALRNFTIADANRALVLVRRIVSDVVAQYARLLDMQETAEVAEAQGASAQLSAARQELLVLSSRLRDCLDELESVGVALVDWVSGAVDFPSVVDGREIRLNWKLGEPHVAHWRGVYDEQRHPLETLNNTPGATAPHAN